ncbi:F box:WD repeat containing protein 9 [Echinococcus multilocularis]|uniref:F box:WD repeat containing protein 9 n=1 Tax=Echinococcus multilocularis TaxID=6211 RepID=A0A068Y3L0_ECHMU|nr:F box:WD repeat containing protein 9 [Echinococcus multilocularis]
MVAIVDLPAPLIQKICDFLPIDDVLSMTSSCDAFASSINQKSFWLRRLTRGNNGAYSCIPEKRLNWKDVCIAHETIERWFSGDHNNLVKRTGRHYTAHCIDAMQILKVNLFLLIPFFFKPPNHNLFAVGDRGGTLSLLSLKALLGEEEPTPNYTDTQAHNGWIWTISSDSNVIATGSWDRHLRVWSMNNAAVDLLSQYRMNSVVLCSDFVDPNLVAVGTFHKELAVFDFRVPSQYSALSNTYHQGTILCLKSLYGLFSNIEGSLSSGFPSTTTLDFSDADSVISTMGDVSLHGTSINNSLEARSSLSSMVSAGDSDVLPPPSQNVGFYSGCKGGILAAWDLRKFSKPVGEHKLRSYPRKISLMDGEEMWVAEHPNRLHVFHAASSRYNSSTPLLSLLRSHKYSGKLGAISALEATPGGVFVALMSRYFDVLHPTMPPRSMLKEPISKDQSGIYVSLSFAHETLLVGGDNGSISLWMSRRRANQLLDGESP